MTYGQQLSGYVSFISDGTTAIDFAVFLDNTGTGRKVGLTAQEFYNFSSTSSLITIPYAVKYVFSITAPEANFVGTCYKGSFPLASIMNEGSRTGTVTTVNQMISLATEANELQNKFTLSGSIGNDMILENSLRQTSASPTIDMPMLYATEMVHYIVLATPAKSITTGTYPYGVIGEITTNTAIMPYFSDSIIYNTFRPPSFVIGENRFKNINIQKVGEQTPHSFAEIIQQIEETPSDARPTEAISVPNAVGPLTSTRYTEFYEEMKRLDDSDSLLTDKPSPIFSANKAGLSIVVRGNPNKFVANSPKARKQNPRKKNKRAQQSNMKPNFNFTETREVDPDGEETKRTTTISYGTKDIYVAWRNLLQYVCLMLSDSELPSPKEKISAVQKFAMIAPLEKYLDYALTRKEGLDVSPYIKQNANNGKYTVLTRKLSTLIDNTANNVNQDRKEESKTFRGSYKPSGRGGFRFGQFF